MGHAVHSAAAHGVAFWVRQPLKPQPIALAIKEHKQLTPDNVFLLNRVKTKMLHFAWDDPNTDLTDCFRRFSELTSIRDFRRRRVYVLTNYGSTHEQDLYRVNTLRDMGYDPFVMIYERPSAPPVTRQLARWVNNKRIFRVVPNFADYIPNPNKKSARP